MWGGMESRGGLETRHPGRRTRLPMRAILTAGLIAGTLDILDAFNFYGFRGVSPVRILQSIAAVSSAARPSRAARKPPSSARRCTT